MQKIKFTKRALAAIEPPAQGRISVGDSEMPSLILTVTSNGAKSFYRYGRVKGRPTRMMLGKFPEMTVEQAHTRCAELNGQIVTGQDVKTALRGGATVADLWAAYFSEHAALRKKESSRKHDQWQWDKILKPKWENRKVSQIAKGEFERFLGDIARTRGKVTANRLLALVRKLFNHGLKAGIVKTNPATGIEKYPEQSRDRFLQPDELPVLFQALDTHPNQVFADFIRIALFVGARRGNLQAMRWDQIDWERAVWRIPDTKANESLTLPLCQVALDVLRRRQASAGESPWVFPSFGKTGHLISPLKTWERMCKKVGISGVTIHDLRRSLGSWQAASGSSELIIGKSLGHAPGSRATSVYARLNLDPVRESIEKATAAMMAAGRSEVAHG